VRLLKQRWAVTAEIMSTMTVMDKNIKSSCRVKYPTEKGPLRGAVFNLRVSRGTWMSESLGEHGCLKARGTWVSERPAEKDPLRGAAFNLRVSRETWVSESLKALGVSRETWVSESPGNMGV